MTPEELNDAAFEYHLSYTDRKSLEGIWIYKMDKPILIDLSPVKQIDLIFQYGYLYDCNDATAKMHGYKTAKEFIGKSIGETLPNNEQNIEFLLAFINSGYVLSNAESREVDAEGRTKYFLNTMKGIIENGFLKAAIGYQRMIKRK